MIYITKKLKNKNVKNDSYSKRIEKEKCKK